MAAAGRATTGRDVLDKSAGTGWFVCRETPCCVKVVEIDILADALGINLVLVDGYQRLAET